MYQRISKSTSSNQVNNGKSSQFAPPKFKVQTKEEKESKNTSVQIQRRSLEGNNFADIPPALRPDAPIASDDQNEWVQRASYPRMIQDNLISSPIQAKLTIGEPGDKYEKEADRVAAQVVQQINSPVQTKSIPEQVLQNQEEELQAKFFFNSLKNIESIREPIVQREEEPDEDEDKVDEELQAKFENSAISSQEEPDEENLQDNSTLQRQGNSAKREDTRDLATAINSARGRGEPLALDIQRSMGEAMGADFSGVRVHTDVQSHQLNEAIQAKAFTTGQDLFFRQGNYRPTSRAGQELIAHELTHVMQQNGSTVQKSMANVVQRKFQPAIVRSKAHLRNKTDWNTHIGPNILAGTKILADDEKRETERRKLGTVAWRPAVNIDPYSQQTSINPALQGYIRNTSIRFQDQSIEDILKLRVKNKLLAAEGKYPSLAGLFDKDENVEFLLDKAIRYDVWNKSPSLEGFVSGFCAKEDKINRIDEGAQYVAESLEHWRKWLHPDSPDLVKIKNVKFLQSDLHEKGLGVLAVKFEKPEGPNGHKFANETNVDVIIKPEDKSLEENLLGDKPDSAANQINQIVGLSDEEALTTIKMACSSQYGSLVEKVRGTQAKDLEDKGNLHVDPVFHETLVFVFLTGLDDLHGENVFWDQGKPYLIDADNVLSYNQMLNKDNGALVQSGFGSNYNKLEGAKNKEATKTLKNTVRSKLLETMIENPAKALKIIDVIKGAISGKEGRVVPIKTNSWANTVKYYAIAANKDEVLDNVSTKDYLVRETTGFRQDTGPGLIGVSSKNLDSPFYDQVAERAQLKKDFDAGVIPFYTYYYDTGFVTHNGVKIYHGQTLEQAMQMLIDKFSPEWDLK